MDEPPDQESLEGTIERIVFQNADRGFTVARLRTDAALVTAVGLLPGVSPGNRVKLLGRFIENPRYGEQFEVRSFSPAIPTDLAGLERYLGSGAFPGIGPVLAHRIVEQLGEESFAVLEDDLERLAAVPGLGVRRAMELANGWRGAKGQRDLLVFLQAHGLSAAISQRLVRHLGPRALDRLREEPHRIAQGVPGIGFRLADRIALALGTSPGAPSRVDAAIVHVLAEATAAGHVYAPEAFLGEALDRLGVPGDAVADALARLEGEERVTVERGEAGLRIFPAPLHAAEVESASLVCSLALGDPPGQPLDGPEALAVVEESALVRLSPGQLEALTAAIREKVLVVTGGPGTGKTTLVRALLRLWELRGVRPLLGAPTGRAAKRLAEATGHAAQTLHRLLEWSPSLGDFARGPDRPLEAEAVLVDEASMIDLPLLHRLLLALPRQAQLVLVGDADQLPSVGPGAVLRDLLDSGRVQSTRLTEVFRQSGRSLITAAAHQIRAGLEPAPGAPGDDFLFVEREDPDEAARAICELVAHELPARHGLSPREDVQVLTPMHRGAAGTRALNEALQRALNPDGPELRLGERLLRQGDRVMQLRNDYERDVFNGDVGRVLRVDAPGGRLWVELDGRELEVDRDELDDLALAYACSVHKAQGSEYPAVVLALLDQHQPMLQRNLLYTAVTRARKLAVIVGSRRALGRAVANARQGDRFSWLAERLRSCSR